MSQPRRKRNKTKRRPAQSAVSEDVAASAEPEDGPVFGVETSPVMGRYMVSRRNLRPGDVILSEEPLVVGPCTGCNVQCLGCYKPLEATGPYAKCSGCGWPLCSARCRGIATDHGHTALECSVLASTGSGRLLDYADFERMRPHFHAIVPLRCLLLKRSAPRRHAAIMAMEAHDAIRRRIPDLWRANQLSVVDRIVTSWGLREHPEEEIHTVCGILEVNAFEIGHQGANIRGLYPTAFLMAHDCVPNTNHVDEEVNYRLTVRASRPVPRGLPITLSYAHLLQNTPRRREHLLEGKFFECTCARCSDPSELGAHAGTLLCPRCKRGHVLPATPLDPGGTWGCTGGDYVLSASSVRLLTDRIAEEVDAIDCNDVVAMEAFLHKYRNVLHPTHYLCLGVKLSLSQLYGRIQGYLIDELDERLLLRKLEICEEIMAVFDIIEPGLTRLRGVTLYEMHAPLMVLLTRQFEKHCSKSEVRSRLKRVVKCLEEAALILGYEPETSPEGVMGLAAKDALVKIKDWEKILGKL